MRKFLWVFVFLGILFVSLAPLACNKQYVLSPLPTPTPTPTPRCGFGTINLVTGAVTPVFTPTPSTTPVAVATFTVFSPFVQTPSVSYPNQPFTGTVIRNLSDWQAVYPNQNPPPGFDFNTEMILAQSFPGCCSGSGGFLNVCETANEVEVSEFYQPWDLPYTCNAVCLIFETIVVPKSILPVILTEVDTY